MLSSESCEWPTPQYFYDRLNSEFNFLLDPAANWKNAKAPLFFSKEDDGLSRSWDKTTFCNPPYGIDIEKWVQKGYEQSKSNKVVVVMLIPARTGTIWWKKWALKAYEIRFVTGRLKFGGAKTSAPFDSAVLIFKPFHVEFPKISWIDT